MEKALGLLIALLAFRAAFIEAFDFEGCEGCDRDGDTGLCDCETGENALLRIKRQDPNSDCTEPNFPTDLPSHLVVPDPFAVDGDGHIRLRCSQGRVLNMTDDGGANGFLTGGYFVVQCDTAQDPDVWVPPVTWPPAENCLPGDPCTVADADSVTGLPAWLEAKPAPGVTEIPSAFSIMFGCKAADKVLNATVGEVKAECYNGDYIPPSAFPVEEACVDPEPCDLSLISSMVPPVPNFITTTANLSTTINHDEKVDYACPDGKFLSDDLDVNSDGLFNLACYNGELEKEAAWPKEADCKAKCTNISVPAEAGYDAPTLPTDVLAGNTLNLTCTNTDHIVNDTFENNYYSVKCMASGEFDDFMYWPSCLEKKPCGVPPEYPVNSALRPYNATTEYWVPELATYYCRDEGHVTDLGPEVSLKCIIKPGEENATFEYPDEWGGPKTKCRAPVRCGFPPIPTLESGLEVIPLAEGEYYEEYDKASYRCKDTSFVMYMNQMEMEAGAGFDVTCGSGGFWDSVEQWPFCDDASPATCNDFLSPLDIIELVAAEPQLPGGKIKYKCKEEGFISNLGEYIEVECVMNVIDRSRSFKQPNGWNNLKCRSAEYPDFRTPACTCPGDMGLSFDQRTKIREMCAEHDKKFVAASMAVPIKKRCGVTSLDSITSDNLCYCNERTQKAADFAIWSRVEITNFDYHINFTEPSTSEFTQITKIIEKELDSLFVLKWPESSWKFVKSKVMTFAPARAKSCSMSILPVPETVYGLVPKTKKAVLFGENAEYECSNPDYVTDDGYTFKLKCLASGQFQRRYWGQCRPRRTCDKTPPRPIEASRLKRNYTRNIKELDYASYECYDQLEVVPGTIDGRYEVMCKKNGWPQSEGKYGVPWPTCSTKPNNICEPVMDPPGNDYEDDFDRTLYVVEGTTISFKCKQEGWIAGTADRLHYKCTGSNSSYSFQPVGHTDVPACREPAVCASINFQTPSQVSGLTKPLQAGDIKELEYIEYTCETLGATWALYGDYYFGIDHWFDVNLVSMVDGKLRVTCGGDGKMGNVTGWPVCRDTAVSGCEISSSNPDLPSGKGLTTNPASGTANIGDTVTVLCSDDTKVTDAFKTLDLKCGYSGVLSLPTNINITNCRAPNVCPASPTPPASTNLVATDLGGTELKEGEVQEYTCNTDFTLAGITGDLITPSGTVEVPCVLENGNFVPPDDWPTCQAVATECTQYPNLPGFVSSSPLPVAVDATIELSCANTEFVTFMGKTVTLTCTESAQFNVPDPAPTCRAAIPCGDPPVPPNSTLIDATESTGVAEWDAAIYDCRLGTAFPASAAGDLVDGKFTVDCLANGAWEDSISWPTCDITHCVDLPTRNGFNTSTYDPVLVGETINFLCAVPLEVPDNTTVPLDITCQADGTFTELTDWPTCRAALTCPTPPVPDMATTFLNPSGDSGVKELQYASYSCKDGANFEGVTNDDIVDDEFRIECLAGGSWPNPINWPTCNVENCTTALVQNGYSLDTSVTTMPIAVGENAVYKCTNAAKVTDEGAQFNVPCEASGDLVKATWPACRDPIQCTPPTPPSGSHLEDNPTTYVEFQTTTYNCKADGKYGNPERTTFDLNCPLPADLNTISWPNCIVANCIEVPDVANFHTDAVQPIAVGATVDYTCQTPGQVTNDGPTKSLTCASDGSFTNPVGWPACRDPVDCTPTPPDPDTANTFLQASQSSGVKEFGEAEYVCQEGKTLDGVVHNGVTLTGNTFKLQCGLNGNYPASPSFPTCIIGECLPAALPTPSGMTTSTTGKVKVGNSVIFTCDGAGEIIDNVGKSISVPCQADGTYDDSGITSCRAAEVCDPNPDPTGETPATHLALSGSSGVKEFDYVEYECDAGYNLVGVIADGVFNNKFYLQCPNGKTYATPNWVICVPANCPTLPTDANFKTSTTEPVPIGTEIVWTCQNDGEIHDNGPDVRATCGADGTIPAPTWPSACRAPNPCTGTIPSAGAATNLQDSTTGTVANEWDYAEYQCQDGYTLEGVAGQGVVNGVFRLFCENGGDFPAAPIWPTCGQLCTNPLTVPGNTHAPVEATPSIAPGMTTPYKCAGTDNVMDSGKYLDVTCGNTGTFTPPGSWPTCRPAVDCPATPAPPQSSQLQASASGTVKEFDFAEYACNNGLELDEANPPPVGKIEGGKFKLMCGGGATWTIMDLEWPTCVTPPASRKKRFIQYEGLKEDIQYTLFAYIETQWMWTDPINDDVLAEKNFTKENPEFPKELIDLYHERVNEVVLAHGKIGPIELRTSGVGADRAAYPTCEQPMTKILPADCKRSYIEPNCQNEVIEGAWLESLGFTYMKQSPNWMVDNVNDTTKPRHEIPVGGAVEFYCSNHLKRPKKDVWDDDAEDGLVSSFCTHGGIMSITMNPGDWDKCRRLCPVQKPKPPTVIGAQLVSYSEEKDDKELWEDDTIIYGCQNESLVIDRKKGVHSVSYKCMDDGTYKVPLGKNEGDPWPECTLKPTDPLIVEAIQLLTAEFDRNLIYRQKLALSDDSETDSLNTYVAMIAITVPAVCAIVAMIFFCMCFTRSDSPVCKVFEPQA